MELTQLTPMAIQKLYNQLTKGKVISDENIQKVHTFINDSYRTRALHPVKMVLS